MSEDRLQKLISRSGLMSRRAAEKIISEGRVTVDGKIISEVGAKANPEKNKICVDGIELQFDEEKIYLLLNKPRGILSAAKDERGRKTVIDLLPGISERVYPVGRLDLNSEGAILLTNDGDLMNELLRKKSAVEKIYRVKISGEITEEKLNLLRNGIELDDGLTAPAKVNLLGRGKNSATVEISIHEGRNRQVRRMFSAVGCDVKKLRRINFAGLTLENLEPGKFRRLTPEEIRRLKKLPENFLPP